MQTLNEIKKELQFNNDLIKLLEIMKNISIAYYQSLLASKSTFSPYMEAVEGFFHLLDIERIEHPFVREYTEKKAVIIFSSDEGFMGSLNAQIINAGLEEIKKGKGEVVILGEKGRDYLIDLGKKVRSREELEEEREGVLKREEDFVFFSRVSTEMRKEMASSLKDYLLKGIKGRRFSKVVVFYARPLSFLFQKVEKVILFPILFAFPSLAEKQGAEDKRQKPPIVESSPEEIIEYLMERWLAERLIEIIEESRLSELSARAIHLEKSKEDLEREQKRIKLRYFRAYHEFVDKNIRETFSAQFV